MIAARNKFIDMNKLDSIVTVLSTIVILTIPVYFWFVLGS